jgi:hypothetical protein
MFQCFEYRRLLMEGVPSDEQVGIIVKHLWVGG